MDVRVLEQAFRRWPVRGTTVPEQASEGACLAVVDRYTSKLKSGQLTVRQVEVLVKMEMEVIADTLSEQPERWVEVPIYEWYLELLQDMR